MDRRGSFKQVSDEDTEAIMAEADEPREQWSRKIEFIFACIGFAVGYGNFWRFPFKAFRNGGGAFLIPFIICLVLAGIPLFFLELAVGQFMQTGPLKAWKKICPLLQGLGYSMILVCILVSIYYNVILAWSIYYFIHSFFPDVPWVGCTHDWNTKTCYDPFAENLNKTIDYANGTSPSREFFVKNVLQITGGIDEIGDMNWKLVLCLLTAWIMVYFCIFKGIRTTGKVVYVTATLPFLMLLIFFIKGLTLPGAVNGITYYVTPVWAKLAEPQVWADAASQVFYSLTLGFGVMLTFASYNDRHNNLYRDALLISITDAVTSIFSGFVVFAIMGYMAEIQGKSIEDPTIATDGPGLVFIVYPAALATLPQPHIWAVIFFLMLITLGLDSQFGQVELVCACLIEEYPEKLKKYKEWVVLACCAAMFLLGLPLVAQGGMYWFHLIDAYCAGLSLLFIGICEIIAMAWTYGADRFKLDIEEMVGFTISRFWIFMWKFVSPLLVFAIFLFSIVKHQPLTYEKIYKYPTWAEALGWLICLCSILCVPIWGVKKMLQKDGDVVQRLKDSVATKLDEEKKSGTELQQFKRMPEENVSV